MRPKIILLLFLGLYLFSADPAFSEDIYITNAILDCPEYSDCEKYSFYVSSFKSKKMTIEEVREKLTFILSESTVKKFNYQITGSSENATILISILPKKEILDLAIEIDEDISVSGAYKVIPLVKGGLYDEKKKEESLVLLRNYFGELGINLKTISTELLDVDTGVSVTFLVKTSGVKRIGNVEIQSDIDQASISRRFKIFKGQVWDKSSIKIELDILKNELKESGYYFANVDYVERENFEKQIVDLNISVKSGERFNFLFNGVSLFSRQELMGKLREVLSLVGKTVDVAGIKKEIVAFYESIGVYSTSINAREDVGKDKDGVVVKTFIFDIREGEKLKLRSISFMGNSFFSQEQILKKFYSRPSALISSGHYDKRYLENFADVLREEYLRNGFISVNISPVEVVKSDKSVNVFYRIKEHQQCILDKILITGVGPDLQNELKSFLVNTEGGPVNILEVDDDILKVVKKLQEKGYYFTKTIESNPEKILKYSSSYNKVDLNIALDVEKRAVLEDILITGNIRTKSEIILREIELKTGEWITPEKLERIKESLVNLGLFSSIKINPVILTSVKNSENYHVNLLISLVEKDYGLFEVAPGFRTDIGLKISTALGYANLWGRNLSNTTRLQVNQRLDYSSFDNRRQKEKKKRVEVSLEDVLTYPYPFGLAMKFEGALSWARRRFYGFDADIFKSSVQISRPITKYLDFSLRYQIEAITQFDATDLYDDRFFRIGSLTPSVSYDRRDNPANPHHGLFLSLSNEFASPVFGSMKKDDLEINYVKTVSRNRFYIPLKDDLTLALSLSVGRQKSLTSKKREVDGVVVPVGQIPTIKVFRLEGVDSVRGFNDDEINRLSSGVDISDEVIDNVAYFTNLKLEPRYLFQDNAVIGLFIDAGRVYKDKFGPMDLRTSAGVTLKYLTPVGSLDFDYGAKLHRNADIYGNREKFGRFHISIGFF